MSKLTKKLVDAAARTAKTELLFGGDGEQRAVHGKVADMFVDEFLDLFKRKAKGRVGSIVDVGKGGNRGVELVEALVDIVGKVDTSKRVEVTGKVDLRDAALFTKDFGNTVEATDELVNVVVERVGIVGNVVANIAECLVEKVGHVFGNGNGRVQAPSNGEGDEANVGRGQEVDIKDDNLFHARNGEHEHGHEAVDRLFDTRRRQIIDTGREIVRHRRQGAASLLDARAGGESLALGRGEFMVEAGNRQEDSYEDEE